MIRPLLSRDLKVAAADMSTTQLPNYETAKLRGLEDRAASREAGKRCLSKRRLLITLASRLTKNNLVPV